MPRKRYSAASPRPRTALKKKLVGRLVKDDGDDGYEEDYSTWELADLRAELKTRGLLTQGQPYPKKKKLSGYPPGKHPNTLKNLKRLPSAEPGNRRAMIHGATENPHRERLEKKAKEVYDALAGDAPVRAHDGSLPRHDSAMVTLLATTLCRLENVGTYLADYGWKDAQTKQPRHHVLGLEAKLRKEAAEYLDALGMTPKSRARLGVDLVRARDLANEWSSPADDHEVTDDDE